MNDKKTVWRLCSLALMLILCVAGGYAQKQRDPNKRETMRRELEEFKIKFIAQEIELKEDQKKQFFEVYNRMNDERIKIFEQTRALERKVRKDANATDADYEALSKAITEAKEKDAEIEKKYDAVFSTFLTSRQIFKIKSSEEKFRRKIHEMWHKKKGKSK